MKERAQRVVITGVGVISSAGNNFDSFWEGITSGQSALRTITNFDTTGYPASVAGEINSALLEQPQNTSLENVDRALLLARRATAAALQDAGIVSGGAGTNLPIGLYLGSGAGPSQSLEDSYLKFAAHGPRGLRPRTVPLSMFNSLSAHLGIEFRLRGPQMTIAAACASANMAMTRTVDLIRSGRAKMMLSGGAEMPLCKTVFASWAALRVLSPSSDPSTACLPFDKRRKGLCLGEGAAIFMFESLESARERGAKIYAEVRGYGENNDGVHITQPDAASQTDAINQALRDAGCVHEEVDYVNAHGTATELNDITETEAIKGAFGAHAYKLCVSSTKSVIGHTLGASGALELVAVLGALRHQAAPPTANLREPDPRCDLDYVPLKAVNRPINIAISNSFAFGGANSVLVLSRYTEGA